MINVTIYDMSVSCRFRLKISIDSIHAHKKNEY